MKKASFLVLYPPTPGHVRPIGNLMIELGKIMDCTFHALNNHYFNFNAYFDLQKWAPEEATLLAFGILKKSSAMCVQEVKEIIKKYDIEYVIADELFFYTDELEVPVIRIASTLPLVLWADHNEEDARNVILSIANMPKEFLKDGETIDFHCVGPLIPKDADVKEDGLNLNFDGRPIAFCSLGSLCTPPKEVYEKVRGSISEKYQFLCSTGKNVYPSLKKSDGFYPWLPQHDLLKKAELFVTACGMNSACDALRYDIKKIMPLPIFFDHVEISERMKSLLDKSYEERSIIFDRYEGSKEAARLIKSIIT